jgi:hypothetical protein
MPTKPHNCVPSIKDKIITVPLDLSAFPGVSQRVLFLNLFYDFEVKSIAALVTVVTTAVASPFSIGFGTYTDIHGNIIPGVDNFYLTLANCVDVTGQPFSTGILPVGTLCFFPSPVDPNGTGAKNLPMGAPLTVVGANTANTGEVVLNIAVRPKDKDRGDSSKRPSGAADDTWATYYK